ncbi:MAG: transporter substrate-binding domain-containing protein [Clostridia bacterium]|nr:transporter substrate-binding domain-containing protein [Clostridia bacterium]
MKKAIALLLALALSLTAFSALAEDALARIQAQGYMVFGTEGNWAPWTVFENGEWSGFDIEVARAVCEKLGVEARFVGGEWSGLLMGLANGMYDSMANGVDVTEERQQTYDFSDPYCFNRTALIVREDNDSLTSFEGLAGKTTANSPNSTYMLLAEQYGATVLGVEDLAGTMSLVADNRVDATLNAEASFYDYMAAMPDAPLKIAAVHEEVTSVAFPLQKGEDRASLREAINQAIAELRAEGVLAAISEKYFGGDLTTPAE